MPTPYTPIPVPYSRSTGAQLSDGDPTFAATTSTTNNYGTGNFSYGALTIPLALRAELAEAIEKCFYQDLSASVDVIGFTIGGGSHRVEIVSDGSVMSAIKVGPAGGTLFQYTLGVAASLADRLRQDTGTTAYQG